MRRAFALSRARAAWPLLLRSYLSALPGMRWLLAVGAVSWLLMLIAADAEQRQVYGFAAAAFLVAVPGLSAGPHLRQLASRRSHGLLPGFGAQLLIATGLLLLGLSAALASLALRPLGMAWPAAAATSAALLSGLFWFGFLPGLPRFLSACVLVGLLFARLGDVTDLRAWTVTGFTATAPLAALVVGGWLLFALWLQWRITQRRMFLSLTGTALHLPLALRLPGNERIGTASGTWLLGSGDAASVRLLRALFGLWLLPSALLGALVWLGGLPLARAIGSPALWLLALGYAFGFFMHLAQRVGERRALLWLRSDGDWLALQRQCERVLLREWLLWATLLVLAWWAVGYVASPAHHVDVGLFLLAWSGGLLLQAALQLLPDARRPVIAMATGLQWLCLAAAVGVLHVSGQRGLLQSLVLAQPLLAVTLRYLAHRQLADRQHPRQG